MTRRILLVALAVSAFAADNPPWNLKELYRAPRTFDAPAHSEKGVKALLFEGPPYKGKPTRVFAWYGAPQAPGRHPAMVLIHGGGGTAFAEWVRMWNARGYAAIAMDTVGTIPQTATAPNKIWNPDRSRHEFSGPAGWGDFANVDLAPQDQWTYHAVAAVVRAHSLLRSFPEVDAKRIGVTGISWGGYLTSIVSGVDTRYKFAAPVYGCGYLGEDSAWTGQEKTLGAERWKKWLELWDPSRYLGRAKLPMLWVNGTNDFAYPLPSWRKSYRLTKGRRTLAVRVRMRHSHPDGAKPEEIHSYADFILKKGPPPAMVTAQGEDGSNGWANFRAAGSLKGAELNYTRDLGKWPDRKWESAPVEIDAAAGRVYAQLPAGVKAYYFNLIDASGQVVSSEHVDKP